MVTRKGVLVLCILLLQGWTLLQAQITYPPRIFGDSIHAPFYHGVASGDPLSNAVIIWTRITPAPSDFTPLTVNYQVSSDSLFGSIVASGSVTTDSSYDWTIKKDITGLSPNSIYYYRFDNGLGSYSLRGRTRTAPSGSISDLKFAVFSCSSIFSGYFNSYARVAEKADSLNAAIHLGDYIYDFVDAEEQVRVPVPYPGDPVTLTEWRGRQAYYLLDPDLRAAKASLPWICLWDNHDQDCGGSIQCPFGPGTEAFLEWVPVRVPDTLNPLEIFRTLSYGDLADIIIADVLMFRHIDTLPNGEYNMLGTSQFLWIQQQLQSSTAKWKLVGNQRMIGGWYTTGIAQWVLDMLPNDGAVFDNNSWDGFPGTKALLFDFLRDQFIDNTIILSGDAHVSIAQDLVEDPNNSSLYDSQTGMGSAGVEFLPTSISRGNMDEGGAPIGAFDLINELDRNANPQHQFTDFFNHGYGILHLKHDSTVAQFWYAPILQISGQDSLGATLIVKNGENHWSRTSGYSSLENTLGLDFHVFPNPANEWITLEFAENPLGNVQIEIFDAVGRTHLEQTFAELNAGNLHLLNIQQLPTGLYFIRINHTSSRKFIKQ